MTNKLSLLDGVSYDSLDHVHAESKSFVSRIQVALEEQGLVCTPLLAPQGGVEQKGVQELS